MPRLEAPIGDDGPIIDVMGWIAAEHESVLRSRGLPRPKPFAIRGLVDTGARITAIQKALAEGMRLPVHDWITISSSVLGEEVRKAPVYQIRMTFGSLEARDAPKWRIFHAVGVSVVSPGAAGAHRSGPSGDLSLHIRRQKASLDDVLLNGRSGLSQVVLLLSSLDPGLSHNLRVAQARPPEYTQ